MLRGAISVIVMFSKSRNFGSPANSLTRSAFVGGGTSSSFATRVLEKEYGRQAHVRRGPGLSMGVGV